MEITSLLIASQIESLPGGSFNLYGVANRIALENMPGAITQLRMLATIVGSPVELSKLRGLKIIGFDSDMKQAELVNDPDFQIEDGDRVENECIHLKLETSQLNFYVAGEYRFQVVLGDKLKSPQATIIVRLKS